MIDIAFQWISQQVNLSLNNSRNLLWVIDENATDAWQSVNESATLSIVTNRFDLSIALKKRFLRTEFSDFDFSSFPAESINTIFYRISKEKAVVNHIANEAFLRLSAGGEFILAGYKNEGIKTFASTIAKRFNALATTKKMGDAYYVIIEKPLSENTTTALDDDNYMALREISTHTLVSDSHASNMLPVIYSKPGQFGWNKFDAGSQLLVETLRGALNDKQVSLSGESECLDLGCGYGFITLMASSFLKSHIKTFWLSDNNAAAILSATENCQRNNLSAKIIPDDCAISITTKMDLLLCNPPFHQGFDIENDLTEKFLLSTKNHLKPNGVAFFVVNKFIPLEKKAEKLFRKIDVLADNGKFKVIRLAIK
jgi:16S rRNA (guanine1207-N2)-methyltransferase